MELKFSECECGVIESVEGVVTIEEGDFTEFLESEYFTSEWIDEILFNEGLESIGNYAFFNQPIEGQVHFQPIAGQVQFPSTLRELGIGAFEGSSIESVEFLGEKVTKIPSFCFNDNSQLEEVLLPKSLVTIEENAFAYCPELKSIVLPESVTSLGFNAFAYCDSLKSVEFSRSLKSIGVEGCKTLGEVIECSPFKKCESLEFVRLTGCEVNLSKSFLGLVWSYLCEARDKGFGEFVFNKVQEDNWAEEVMNKLVDDASFGRTTG